MGLTHGVDHLLSLLYLTSLTAQALSLHLFVHEKELYDEVAVSISPGDLYAI